MFTDALRQRVMDDIGEHDVRAFAKFITPGIVTEAAQRCGRRIGKSPLHLGNLVWLGLAAALHHADSFARVLTFTLKTLTDMQRFAFTPVGRTSRSAQRTTRRRRSVRTSKHDPRGGDACQPTEEGFTQARASMPCNFWMTLLLLLAERFETDHGDRLRFHGFRLIALDGTTLNLPQWKTLQAHYGMAGNRRQRRPQARLLMLQFPLARLPYRYAIGPLPQSEKTLAGPLLNGLRANDLVLIDRGFFSFGLFCQVARQHAHFATRQMATVKFSRTIRRLGPLDRIARWIPSERKWKTGDLPTSLDLRVIDYQIPGFRPSAVVTSVLDPAAVSRDEWVRLATTNEAGRTIDPGLYHRRWEIETTFFELKVSQGMEGHLRGRTPATIEYEIAGHILLYFLTRWLMVEAAQAHHREPLRLSFRNAHCELVDMRQTLMTATPQRVATILLPRLLQRIADHVVPFRPGRHYPRPNDTRIRVNRNGTIRIPAKLQARQT